MVQDILLRLKGPHNNLARSGRIKTLDSIELLQANVASSTWRVSGELGISQSNVVHHIYDLS